MASSEPPPLLLTPIDNVVVRFYTNQLLFFPESKRADVSTVIDTLRHGLSKTLEAIPVLAGTPQVIDQRGTLCIDAPWSTIDEIFRVNDLRQEEGLEYKLLKDKHFPVNHLDVHTLASLDLANGKIVPPPGSKMKSERPVIFVQVNIIKGGIIVALCLNHSFTDGNGVSSIVEVWGAYCRGDDGSRLITPDMVHRGRLMEGRSGASSAVFPEFEKIKTQENPPSSGFLNYICTTIFGYLTARLSWRPTGIWKPQDWVWVDRKQPETAIFFFSKRNLVDLKSMASGRVTGDPGDRWISTIDALSALIGCCVASARAQETRAMGDKNWVIYTALGGRRLLDPPLPAGYIGNFLSYIRICTPNPTIESTPAKVAEIAHLIRDQIKQRGDAFFQGIIGALSSVKDLRKISPMPLSSSEEGILITSWANQSLYDIDWGDVVGGRVERVRRLRLDWKYICWIMPELKAPYFADDECGLEIIVGGLTKDERAQLKQNELLMKFAQCRCD